MTLIAKITDDFFGLENKAMNQPMMRYASRGVVMREDHKIAIFHKANKNEYKLPGGGLNINENYEDAFIREVLEETGCIVKRPIYLGDTLEIKSHSNFIQESKVFYSKVVSIKDELYLTDKEKDEGGKLCWFELDEAIQVMKSCLNHIKASKYESVYMTKFIVARDIKILEYFKTINIHDLEVNHHE